MMSTPRTVAALSGLPSPRCYAFAACLLAMGPAYSQGQEFIVDSVRIGDPNVSQSGKAICVDTFDALQQHVSVLNGKLYLMETHRESGYDIRHEDRVQIMVLINQKLDPINSTIRHIAYDGKGAECTVKLKEGIALADAIYSANLAYRVIDPVKSK